MLKRQLGERRDAAAERGAVDFFDVVIDELEKPGSGISESVALDLLFLMLFASHETTSIGLTAILKFLTDNPEALQELTVSEIFSGYLVGCCHIHYMHTHVFSGGARMYPEKKGGSRI